MTYSRENEIAGLEQQLAKAKHAKETNDELQKLMKNPLFRKVVLEGFCTKECARYVRESVDPALTPEQRADALGFAQAAGYLLNWFAVSEQLSGIAANDIGNIDMALEVARSETDE